MRRKIAGTRYHVVIIDRQDLDKPQPESALMENDDLELCRAVLAEYLGDTAGIVRAFIEDTTTGTKIYSWEAGK